jgi:hypothetical protein
MAESSDVTIEQSQSFFDERVRGRQDLEERLINAGLRRRIGHCQPGRLAARKAISAERVLGPFG